MTHQVRSRGLVVRPPTSINTLFERSWKIENIVNASLARIQRPAKFAFLAKFPNHFLIFMFLSVEVESMQIFENASLAAQTPTQQVRSRGSLCESRSCTAQKFFNFNFPKTNFNISPHRLLFPELLIFRKQCEPNTARRV